MPRKMPIDPIKKAELDLLQWGRGSDASEDAARPAPCANNTALQWGRGSDASEDVTRSTRPGTSFRRFNGAEAVMPRKILKRLGFVWLVQSFNGAEAVMPRKMLVGGQGGRPGLSLLQWGRGSDASEDQHQMSRTMPDTLLQWGRGSDASEDAGAVKFPPRHRGASMGPRQ